MTRRIVALAAGFLLALPSVSLARFTADGDADGVPDDRDRCLYSPRGVVVGPDGCSTPGDEDEDGVADAGDACPLSPAGALVDDQGCALDADIDGIADGIDACPASRVGAVVDPRGCADGDRAVALPSRRPRPAVAAAVVVPTPDAPVLFAPQPAAATVPAVPVTVPAVPVIRAVPGRSEPARTIYFDPGSSVLSGPESSAVRAGAAILLPELDRNPDAVLVVSGHADTRSDGVHAPRLAADRATAVRQALIEAGVPAQRLGVRVPGVNEPRFHGVDLARNCRAELRVANRSGPGSPAAMAGPASRPPIPLALAPPKGSLPASKPTQPAAEGAGLAIPFAPYSAMLDEAAITALNRFVQDSTRPLLADGSARIVVVGGTDSGETGAAAVRLAESRAASVSTYLVSLGVPRNRVEVATGTQTGARRADLSVAGR